MSSNSSSYSSTSESFVFDSLFVKESDSHPPNAILNKYLVGGEIKTWNGPMCTVYSPLWVQGSTKPTPIGSYAMLTEKEAVEAVDAARAAFGNGRGEWPTSSPKQRIQKMEEFLHGLRQKRDEIVTLLMWEICKVKPDAEKEVDRTIKYIEDTIEELKTLENNENTFRKDSGIVAQIRRAPYGVVLCCGPFNYPFNETYTTLIPAIIMGNSVILKVPRVGVLCHMPTLELFQKIFPPGVVNIISGSGRSTLPALMKDGKVDVFAFIGTSTAADQVQKAHPKPHRLRVCLGLEAKNPAIILPDADMKVTVEECLLGSLSFNGQRCTALKILFVHESIADTFVTQFAQAVDNLKMGLPWEKDVKITPLPEEGKPGFLRELIQDAIGKGAKVVNKRGNQFDRTFVAPSVLYPVNKTMRCYHEEQFGPLIPIATFKELSEVYDYLAESQYGQQASIFSNDPDKIAPLLDILVNQTSRVNINTQCQRGPDSFPFTGRKDSAYGTLSIYDALRVFSIRSVVATKLNNGNSEILSKIIEKGNSNFLRMDYLF